MNEPLFNATTHQISLLYEAWMNNEISTSEWAEHSHRLNQQLLESVRSAPAIADNPCHGCRHFYGKTHSGNTLVCAMHPNGVESDCPDREEGEQYQRKLDLQQNDEWEFLGAVYSYTESGTAWISETREMNRDRLIKRVRKFDLVDGRRVLRTERIRSIVARDG